MSGRRSCAHGASSLDENIFFRNILLGSKKCKFGNQSVFFWTAQVFSLNHIRSTSDFDLLRDSVVPGFTASITIKTTTALRLFQLSRDAKKLERLHEEEES